MNKEILKSTFEDTGTPTGDHSHDGEQVQPSNWMGFDRFSEQDNQDISWARWYADKRHVVPSIGADKERLYLLIDKLAQTLDEIEQKVS